MTATTVTDPPQTCFVVLFFMFLIKHWVKKFNITLQYFIDTSFNIQRGWPTADTDDSFHHQQRRTHWTSVFPHIGWDYFHYWVLFSIILSIVAVFSAGSLLYGIYSSWSAWYAVYTATTSIFTVANHFG